MPNEPDLSITNYYKVHGPYFYTLHTGSIFAKTYHFFRSLVRGFKIL